MICTARFAQTCCSCGQTITPGAKIDYDKLSGARHLVCPRYCPSCGKHRHIYAKKGAAAARNAARWGDQDQQPQQQRWGSQDRF